MRNFLKTNKQDHKWEGRQGIGSGLNLREKLDTVKIHCMNFFKRIIKCITFKGSLFYYQNTVLMIK